MANFTTDLTYTLASALSNLPPPDKIQDADRMRLLGVVGQLQIALEPPQLRVQRFCFSHYGIVVIRIAQGMGIFDAFVEAQGKNMTLKELSSNVQGDKVLLRRVMRFLSAHHIFKQTMSDTYEPLPLAMAFGKGSMAGDMIKHFHTNMQVTAKLFDYFELNGYKNPEDAYDAPFQLAFSTKSHYFEWLRQNPTIQETFNSVMTQSQQYRGADWFEFYPVQENLQVSSDRVLLVDIGGGVGHDITAFKKCFPDLPGKLILQDLPQVIDAIKEPLPEGITAIGHNMFEPQPVSGAKAYYLRTVLHDFPDKQAVDALLRIRDVMTEDSVLLVHEHTMSDDLDIPSMAATLDIHMMEIFSSLERTEKEWIALLEKSGFKVVKVWNEDSVGQSTSLFEAILP